jgi:uncharacterized membrane-anchored protein
MLEERVKELQNQVDGHSRHNKYLNRRLDTFRRKEAAEKQAAEEMMMRKTNRSCH